MKTSFSLLLLLHHFNLPVSSNFNFAETNFISIELIRLFIHVKQLQWKSYPFWFVHWRYAQLLSPAGFITIQASATARMVIIIKWKQSLAVAKQEQWKDIWMICLPQELCLSPYPYWWRAGSRWPHDILYKKTCGICLYKIR